MPNPSNSKQKISFDISSLTLVKILAIIIVIFFLFYIRDVLMLIFIALVLGAALDPWVDWLQQKKIPRSLSMVLIYVCLLSVAFLTVDLIITPITNQVKEFSQDFPIYWEKLAINWQNFQALSQSYGLTGDVSNYLSSVQTSLGQATGSAVGGILSFLGGIISFFLILVMTFYFVVEDKAIKNSVRQFLPVRHQSYFIHLADRMQEKIGLWLRGQLLLCLIIFLLSWIGLTALGVKYALVLALFAGLTEIIPYLGPLIGAIPAVFVAFIQSPVLGLLVIVLYLIIQQAENYLIVPKVMQRAVGLNPITIIIAMLIGQQLAGLWGILLAVPVATAINVGWSDWLEHRQHQESADN